MPSSINTWSCLWRLDITGCTNIKEFPNVSDSIGELVLWDTGIEEVPPRIEKLFRLRKLIMNECAKLKKISPNVSKLENLELLCLCTGCFGMSGEYVEYSYANFFEAKIKWGPDLKRSWRLQSDFNVDYILPICLPKKALTSPISLYLYGDSFKTLPGCIRILSGLTKLDVTECRSLVALSQLPGSLLSINAQGCKYLKRIDSSSFQNPKICLNFAGCSNLNQKARKLIQTSSCKYAVLPGEEVPAHFTHRASSGSLTINLTPTSLLSSLRFKACILLSKGKIYSEGDGIEISANSLVGVSSHFRGKHNGLTVRRGSNQLHMPGLDGCREHLYIFEDSFSLNQDFPETEEAIFSELSFVFRVHDKTSKVKGCGVRLLEEVTYCILDEKETQDEECMVINIEANNESAGGQDEEKEDDDEGVDVEEDIEDDVNDNDTGFSDEGMDINIGAENETEEGDGEESGFDEYAETSSRKRMRLSLE